MKTVSYTRIAGIVLILAATRSTQGGGSPTVITWTGAGPSPIWSDPDNWSPQIVPNDPSKAARFEFMVPSGDAYLLSTSPTIHSVVLVSGAPTLHLGDRTLTLTDPEGMVNAGLVLADDNVATIDGTIHNQPTGVFLVLANNALRLHGPFVVNAGTIEVGLMTGSSPILGIDANVTINDVGEVRLIAGNAMLETGPGATLTVEAEQTVHGRGTISAVMINKGTVASDVGALQLLRLHTNDKVNTGIMTTTNGARIEIESITLINTGGLLLADTGEINLELGAAIVGGAFDTHGTGLILAETSSVEAITNNGLLRIDPADTLTVYGPTLTNNGNVELGTGTGSTTTMWIANDVALTGAGEIFMRDSVATIASSDGFTFTIDTDQFIHGRGIISAAVTNYGAIRSEYAASQLLRLNTNDMTNHAIISTSNGARIEIEGITLLNTDGILLADTGEINLELGAEIVGGMLDTGSTGLILAETSSVEAITNNGHLRIDPGDTLTVYGPTFTNNGNVELGTGTGSTTTMWIANDVALTGAGEIFMRDGVATIASSSGFTVTNDAGHFIHGRGKIDAAISNIGTIEADQTAALAINPIKPGVINSGTIAVTGSGGLVINNSSLFGNTGQVSIAPTRELTANGGYFQSVGTTMVRGTLDTNAGSISIYGGILLGDGTIEVEGIVDNVSGSVQPGMSVGALTITGHYGQGPGAELKIELSGAVQGTEYDLLDVSGDASLAGTLNVIATNGFAPTTGDRFEIVTAANVLGAFDSTVVPAGLRVIYAPSTVLLDTCVANDFDCDGDLQLDDYVGLADCLNGPNQLPAPSFPTTVVDCLAAFDSDSDRDVDLEDAAAFTRDFTP